MNLGLQNEKKIHYEHKRRRRIFQCNFLELILMISTVTSYCTQSLEDDMDIVQPRKLLFFWCGFFFSSFIYHELFTITRQSDARNFLFGV